MFTRFNIDIKAQRIIFSFIALGVALLVAFLQGDDLRLAKAMTESATRPPVEAQQQTAEARSVTTVRSRDNAVAQAVRWLKAQEGGKHRGHTIARHVGNPYDDLEDRIKRDSKRVASGFFDTESAAIAIVRNINHKPNKPRVQR